MCPLPELRICALYIWVSSRDFFLSFRHDYAPLGNSGENDVFPKMTQKNTRENPAYQRKQAYLSEKLIGNARVLTQQIVAFFAFVLFFLSN